MSRPSLLRHDGPARSSPGNGPGIAALVCGIVGAGLAAASLVGPLAFFPGLAALILGIVGIRAAAHGQATNRIQAIAGTGLGAMAMIWTVVQVGDLLSSSDSPPGPLEIGEAYSYNDGLRVGIDEVATVPGGIRVRVKMVNRTDARVDLSGLKVTADDANTGDDGTPPVDPASVKSQPLPGTLAGGATATVELVYHEATGAPPLEQFHVRRNGGSPQDWYLPADQLPRS